MKKLDKLILGAYLGPFLVSLPVVIFIFLVQTILKYIDELVGKDIGFLAFAKLCLYFSMNLFPVCLPLAVLLGSLIAFGNMGEHNELTAIKSSGISLVRILRPAFLVVFALSVFSFWFSDVMVPKVNLKAYSLLYDIRRKKPSLDIREGVFYNGLPGYIIKISDKSADGKYLKDIMIYNHTQNHGNTEVTVADSGMMYTFMNEQYMALELFHGANYVEYLDESSNTLYPKRFVKTKFDKSKIVFSLASFALKKTEEGLFKGNRQMKSLQELSYDIDSFAVVSDSLKSNVEGFSKLYTYQYDSLKTPIVLKDTVRLDSLYASSEKNKEVVLAKAVNTARSIKSYFKNTNEKIESLEKDKRYFSISYHQKYTNATVCLLFFLIGAPLGAIIKKGGLGVPMIVCISFFVVYYVINMVCEKYAKDTIGVNVAMVMWTPSMILLPIGMFFLRQARNDSRVFDPDLYKIYFDRVRTYFNKTQKA
ncbi:MAG: LptF/LptG family permease [Cytophagaceae bacterium]|jgi:lipopolysaccharide export system permease protein|nr:LptF/LptG family permease [Cytophagaceae bacterium]